MSRARPASASSSKASRNTNGLSAEECEMKTVFIRLPELMRSTRCGRGFAWKERLSALLSIKWRPWPLDTRSTLSDHLTASR